MLSNILKLFCDQLLMILKVQLVPDNESSWSHASNSSSFSMHQSVFIFNIKSLFSKRLNQFLHVFFLTEHGHRKSQQEFYVLQLKISFE